MKPRFERCTCMHGCFGRAKQHQCLHWLLWTGIDHMWANIFVPAVLFQAGRKQMLSYLPKRSWFLGIGVWKNSFKGCADPAHLWCSHYECWIRFEKSTTVKVLIQFRGSVWNTFEQNIKRIKKIHLQTDKR